MHKDDVARISSPKQDLLRNLPCWIILERVND